MQNQLIYLLELLLKKNQIKFDEKELSFQIKSHPSYPSLHSITGVLDHFNIENLAIKIPPKKEILNKLPKCFLAQVDLENGLEIVLVERVKDAFVITNSLKKKRKILEDEFLTEFTGIMVMVEKTNDNEFNTKTSVLNWIVFGVVLVSAAFLIKGFISSYYQVLYLMLGLIGFYISLVILQREFGVSSFIGDKFCSGNTTVKNCDAVLNSKGAEIIKGYKLSDFCILYFGTLSILSFFQIPSLDLSYWISIVTTSVTVYSIYYQWIVVKKWCFLCLSIVGVLWFQALIAIYNINTEALINTTQILSMVLIASTSFLSWIITKPLIVEYLKLNNKSIEYTRFKRNYSIFKNLLSKTKSYKNEVIGDKKIVFGNKKSRLNILIITNPFCGHCKPVHVIVEKLLKRYGETISVTIRFNINISDLESDVVGITTRLLEINNTLGEEKCLLAMSDIYENRDVEYWFKKWGKCEDIDLYFKEIEKEKQWCQDNKINFTPEIFANGMTYPKEYERADLLFFIEDLKDELLVEDSVRKIS